MDLTHVRPEGEGNKGPSYRTEEVGIKPVPETPMKPPASTFQRLGPVLLIISLPAILIMFFKARGGFAGPGMIFPVMAMAGMMMMFSNRRGDRKNNPAKERGDYMRYVDSERQKAVLAAEAQYAAARFHYPRAQELSLRIGSPRMWERRPGSSAQFGHVRVGVGVEDAARSYSPLQVNALEDLEPACVAAVNDLVGEHAFVRDIPRPLALFSAPAWSLVGDEDAAAAAARAMLVHLAFFHGPDDLTIGLVTDAAAAPKWDWAKWLPHCRLGPNRSVLSFDSTADLVVGLGPEFAERGRFSEGGRSQGSQLEGALSSAPAGPLGRKHLVVVVDSSFVDWSPLLGEGGGREGVTVVDLTGQCPMAKTATTLVYRDGQVLRGERIEQ